METLEVNVKTKWNIDTAHSEIGFRVKHLMVANVRGTFNEFNGTVNTTGDDFVNAEIDLHLNPASIDTGDAGRDGHLKNADFFDAENFKEMHFAADTFEKVKGNNYKLHGNLTMKGVTKPVALDVEFAGLLKDPWGNQKAVFSVSGKINRKDWGLSWNVALEAGGVIVSEDVWINCEIQLAKQL